MQQDERGLRRSIRTRKLTGPIKAATKLTMKPDEELQPGDNPDTPDNEEVENIVGLLEVPELPPEEKFNKQSDKDKMGTVYSILSQVCDKLKEVNTSLHDDMLGVITRLTTVQTQADNNTTAIFNQKTSINEKAEKTLVTKVQEEVGIIKQENLTLRGVVQRQHGQIKVLNSKVAYLTKKSMENNVIISGLEGDIGSKEKCDKNVIKFLKDKVKIEVEEEEILVAHRSTTGVKGNRNMIVRCTFSLKERIFQNLSNLKDIKNSKDIPYNVYKQLPDVMIEHNRHVREKIRAQKTKDADLPAKERSKIEVKGGEVYINGEQNKPTHLLPIEPLDMFPAAQEKTKWNALKMSLSDVKSEKGSDFIAMAVKATHFVDVKRAYRKARALYPAANHVIAAYKLRNGYDGFQDDDEHGAGHKLLKELQAATPVSGLAVFVARTYDGTHIGPKRHTIIADTMKQALGRLEKQGGI